MYQVVTRIKCDLCRNYVDTKPSSKVNKTKANEKANHQSWWKGRSSYNFGPVIHVCPECLEKHDNDINKARIAIHKYWESWKDTI